MSFSGSPKGATRPQTGVGGTVQENRRSFGADFLRNHYFGGVLESAGGGGGVVLPLLDESGGGFAWSAGGVLCIEFEESGAAGAVVAESEGALGDVDCCLEQATIARALKHNKRRLRFIDHLTVYRVSCPGTHWRPGWTQRLDASSVPRRPFNVPVSSRLRLFKGPPDMLRALAALWGK